MLWLVVPASSLWSVAQASSLWFSHLKEGEAWL
jgi:hypothetical protein